jgi:hypothetical protein
MNNREKSTTLLNLISTAAFFLYGLYCVVSQTAYLPANSHDDYFYTRMEGSHAIAFGASLVLLAACLEVARRLRANGGNDYAEWTLRGIGLVIAAIGIWYAMSGGVNIN